MKKFKKVLLSILSLALVAILSIGGTLAYLTSEDSDVNVMTMGNVKIAQHEYERATNANGSYKTDTIDGKTSYVLQKFTQDKPLYPAIIPNGGTVGGVKWDYDTIPVRMSQVGSHGGASVFNTQNAQDKFVTVENTGKSDAYVRTLIAFEVGTATLEDTAYPNQPLISSEIRAELADKNTNGKQPWTYGYMDYVTINGNTYLVYELVYTGAKLSNGSWRHENGILPAGETTYPNLSQVYMASRATNEDVEALDGNNNGKYDILVLSQAVQTKGFDNAQAALDTAFGTVEDNAAEWFGKLHIPAVVNVSDYASLQAAVDAATEPTIIKLDKNITEPQVKIGPNKNITIIGQDGVVFDGQLFVTGTLNVKNLTVTNKNAASSTVSKQSYNAFYVQSEGQLYIDNSVINIEKATGIATWWETGKGTYVEVTNTTFNANGQRPIQSEGDITVDNCTFNDQYRYSIQLTAEDAIINFTNNKITQSGVAGNPTYALQLTSDYGNSNLTINVANNTIENAGADDILYVWEDGVGASNGFVDIDTITINGGELVKLS